MQIHSTFLPGLHLLLLLIARPTSAQPEPVTQQHVQSIRSFSEDVFKELSTDKGNIFASPLSVQIGLAMLQLGARGTTLTQLANTLHLPQDETALGQMYQNFFTVFSQPKDDPRYNLTIANRVFLNEGFTVKEAFSTGLADYFQAELGNVAFSNREQSVKTINTWVEEQTNDKIKDLLTPDLITDATQMVLVNTVYFLGKWLNQFPADKTQEKIFYKVDGTTMVSTMVMTKSLEYYEDNNCLDAKLLRLPYEGEEIFMTIVLPNEKDGVSSLFGKCCSVFEEKPFTNTNVLVNLPKFKFSMKIVFNDILKKLGAGIAFTSGADFSGVTDEMRLGIDLVLQQAFVDVTESGTEAAAATAVIVGRKSIINAEPPKTFIADHPFVFFLSDKNGFILFVGRYSGEQ